MPFDWPTPEQVIYRITRLRRLIAVAITLPVIVLLGMALVDPSVLFAERATLATLAVVALFVGHVVIFPNVTLETISLSFSVTILIISVPWIRAVAHWAPAEHVPAAFVILIAFAVAATGVFLALFLIILGALAYAGPSLKLRLKTSLTVPCSVAVAHRQFTLKPQSRRGRVLTGPTDEDGFFDVAVASTHVADPENPDLPLIVKIDAKVLASTPARHDVMMLLGSGSVTVTSQEFSATPDGCRIDVSDLPGDFTAGMHLLFWLTDQHADNMTEIADVIIGQCDRANGLAHGVSLLSVAGTLLSPREPMTGRAR